MRPGVDRGIRSFMSHAAGTPVARVVRPRTRYAHAGPSLRMRASRLKEMAAAPQPPPATMRPFAMPRLERKYWDGMVRTTYLCELGWMSWVVDVR